MMMNMNTPDDDEDNFDSELYEEERRIDNAIEDAMIAESETESETESE